MQLAPPPQIARAGLRALKAVACADGDFGDLERQLIGAAQKHILHTDFDIDELPGIEPSSLAAAIPVAFRERLLNACSIVALIDGEATAEELAVLEQIADAFEISSQVLVDVRRLVNRHLRLLRVDLLRRSFIGKRVGAYLADNKLRGFANLIQGVRGKPIPALAEKYAVLADYPAGTLGRGYLDFIRDNQFNLPGEADGPPEPILFHDCLHVLGDYDTTPLGETQIASFQSGIMKVDAIFGMFFMLAQFHLGVQMTPVTEGVRMAVDPELMIAAFVRGTKVNRDLTLQWDPWDDFGVPIDELRARYNVVPR